jgi:hypothetical protein
MAKMLALVYTLAVFTLFYPFFAFLHLFLSFFTFFTLFSPQPKLKSSPKQQKQPKTPISKGERSYYLQEIQTQKKESSQLTGHAEFIYYITA